MQHDVRAIISIKLTPEEAERARRDGTLSIGTASQERIAEASVGCYRCELVLEELGDECPGEPISHTEQGEPVHRAEFG
jgi:hypothetical protein